MFSRFPIFNPLGIYTRCISKAIWKACKTTTVVHTPRHFIQMHHPKPIQRQQCNTVQHTFNNSNSDNTTTNLLFFIRHDSVSELHMLEHGNDDSFDGGVLVDLLPDVTYQTKAEHWWNPQFLDVILEFELVGSCNGLLCLTDAAGFPVTVLNPVNGDYMKLPRLEGLQDFERKRDFPVVSGFGFDEVANLYKVITILAYYYDDSTCIFEAYVHTLGSGRWRNLGEVPYKTPVTIYETPYKNPRTLPRTPLRYRQKEQVLANGAIHWILEVKCNKQFEHILAFHVGREEFQIIPLPPGFIPSDLHHRQFSKRVWASSVLAPEWVLQHCEFKQKVRPARPPDWSRWRSYLCGLGGYLCVFRESDYQCYIWVMKEYGVQGSWTKEYVIPREGPGFNDAFLSPVILTKNGNILVNVNGESLFYYDRKSFSPLKIRDGVLPKFDLVVAHVPSRKLIKDILGQTVSKVEHNKMGLESD